MDTLWQDLRLGLRQLLGDRAFSLAAILTLTLGIGATSAMLTVLNSVLLKELPYRDPGQLVMLEGVFQEKGAVKGWSLSELDVADLRKRNTAFSALSIFGKLAFNLEQGQQSRRLQGELVNDSYFPLLGLQPALGRTFNAEEDTRPLEQYVVVLGYDLWQTTFGGDPGVLGRSLKLNGRSYRVVGVAPQGFRGLSDVAEIWVPSMLPPVREFLTMRKLRWAEAAARLRPGVSPKQAQNEMSRLAGALAQDLPDSNRGIGVTVTPLQEFWLGKLRNGLLVLTIGAFIILLIGCINVASLLLARAAAKQRAFGIRVALGASRRRLVRQLLTESVLLSLFGALFGLVLARWATGALLALSGVQFPSFVHITAGPLVILTTVGLAVLSGLAFGLAPLWITFRSDLTQTLSRDEKLPPRGKGWHRFQNAVVIAQVALALTLLVDATLMAKGFRKRLGEDLGFRPANLLTFRIDLRGPKYVDESTDTALLRREYLRRISAVPGVLELAMSDPNMPSDDLAGGYITIESHASDAPDGTYFAMMHAVTPAYFHLLGIPILRGRAFTLDDTQSNAVLVSQALADQQWPGQDPIGKRLKLDVRSNPDVPWLTVVGVTAEVRHEGMRGERAPAPDLYLSLLQFIRRPPLTVNFLVRPRPGVSTAQLRHALHEEMRAIDPEVPDYDVATLAERLARQTDKARFQVLLLGIFTVLALVLATVGIYGVISYSVTQRTREIAIRVSLGADRAGILRLVVGKGARLAAIGVALGLAAVFALRPLLVDLLYQTSLADPLVLGGTSLALFLVALAANYLPARRAAIVNPMTGLRLQ